MSDHCRRSDAYDPFPARELERGPDGVAIIPRLGSAEIIRRAELTAEAVLANPAGPRVPIRPSAPVWLWKQMHAFVLCTCGARAPFEVEQVASDGTIDLACPGVPHLGRPPCGWSERARLGGWAEAIAEPRCARCGSTSHTMVPEDVDQALYFAGALRALRGGRVFYAIPGTPACLPGDPIIRRAWASTVTMQRRLDDLLAPWDLSGIDRYRVAPPADDASPRRCAHHPHEEAVYVAISVDEGAAPATVRGWTCPKCWTHTRRSFAVAEYELKRAGCE